MTEAAPLQHLTGVRALVLDILATGGNLTRAEMVAAWEDRRPDVTSGHREKLPRMLDETLWRLLNLRWVQRNGDTYALTPEGVKIRATACAGK